MSLSHLWDPVILWASGHNARALCKWKKKTKWYAAIINIIYYFSCCDISHDGNPTLKTKTTSKRVSHMTFSTTPLWNQSFARPSLVCVHFRQPAAVLWVRTSSARDIKDLGHISSNHSSVIYQYTDLQRGVWAARSEVSPKIKKRINQIQWTLLVSLVTQTNPVNIYPRGLFLLRCTSSCIYSSIVWWEGQKTNNKI